MNWETFYLVAFLVGFLLSAVSFLAGMIHLPHFHVHGHGHIHAHGGGHAKGGLSPLNFGTIAAFLAWFGGTGYLLERYSHVWVYLGLLVAWMSGLGGASVVFLLSLKLGRSEQHLD